MKMTRTISISELLMAGAVAIAFAGSADAQVVIDNNVNATDGVQNVLLGGGVTVSNITWSGANDQIGSFDCVNCNVGIESGIVIGSGNVNGAAGPNTSGSFALGPASGWGASDPDLAELSGFSLNDAAVLEFDFIPTGDSLAFNFVFASDEYPEFSNSSFNDAFGFFLSGPGINGPYLNGAANIALIPSTTIPVTINNLNNGNTGTGGPCEFCQYYIHNGNGSSSPQNSNNFYIQGDGFTTVLTAFAQVECGETYHIKLAVADAGDASYDSWVFLEEGSFQSNQLEVAYTGPEISPGDDSVYEGCQPGELLFTRPPGSTGDVTYTVIVSGSAESGVDFEPLPAELTFAAGQNTAILDIVAIADAVTEGSETVVVEITNATTCGGGELVYELLIVDLPPLSVQLDDVMIDCGQSATLTPQVFGGIGFYTILWDGIGTGASIAVAPPFDMTYEYVVLDTCGVTPYQGTVNVTFPDYPPIAVDLGPDQTLTCLDPLEIISSVSGGFGAYQYAWSAGGGVIGTTDIYTSPSSFAATFTLTITDDCGVTGAGSMEVTIPPVPVTADAGPDVESDCLSIVTFSGNSSGGIGQHTYQWSYNGQLQGTELTQDIATSIAGSVELIVQDECGNTGTDEAEVSLPPVPVTAQAGPDQQATCLDFVELSGSAIGGIGEYSYLWTESGGFVSSSAETSVQSGQSTTYVLTVTDECGNNGADQVIISIPPVPVQVDAGEDVVMSCLETANFQSTVTGGVGEYSYLWTSDMEDSAVLGIGPDLSVESPTPLVISLTVSDECGHTGTDQVEIILASDPIFVTLTPDTTICIGQQLILEAQGQGGVGSLTYLWLHDGSIFPESVVAPGQSQVYTVVVGDDCGNSASATVSVGVDVVVPGFTATYTGDFGVSLENQSINAVSYQWIFSDGSSSEDVDVSHQFLNMDPWQVTLVAIGSLGCEQRITEVFYPPGSLYIPDCFTPDQDNLNDVFQVQGHDIGWFKIWIYDRWGDLVYYSESLDGVWDGSDRAGDYFSRDGVYIYRVEAQGVRGNIIEKEGTITLIR
ncbi:MAG: choice-of-anchor L domain-containing protein [Flavobacteriales bacterium]